MARPGLGLGEHGKITTVQMPSGAWKARCKYRSRNGEILRPSATGPTENAATKALNVKLAAMTETARPSSSAWTRETRFRVVAQLWLDDLAGQAAHQALAAGTVRTYASLLKTVILPRLGGLRLWEVDVACCDDLLTETRNTHSFDTAKSVRTVTGQVLGFAVRRGALTVNPMRSAGRLARGRSDVKQVQAMTPGQIEDMLAALRVYADTKTRDSRGRRVGKRTLVWADLPDLVEAMLATGCRIGEVLALTGPNVRPGRDGQRTEVTLDGHIVRVTGEGLQRVPLRKGNRDGLVLQMPVWAAPMLARRKLAAGLGALFAPAVGDWLDPSNTSKRLRTALDDDELGWVTSHVWRKTVATFLDGAGLEVGEVANQLGNSRAVATKHYIAPRSSNSAAAEVLDGLRPTRKA